MAIYGIFNANPNFIRIMEKEDDDDDDDDADGKKRRCSALEYQSKKPKNKGTTNCRSFTDIAQRKRKRCEKIVFTKADEQEEMTLRSTI